MIKLKSLIEVKFRNYKSHVHLADVPMFSIYADASLGAEKIKELQEDLQQIKSIFSQARNEIHKIGFPSMKANVVFKDLSERVNQNTGEKGVGGYAHRGKYMAVDLKNINTSIIVHEWAHLWMFNNSKVFKQSIQKVYNEMVKQTSDKLDVSGLPLTTKMDSNIEEKVLKAWERGFINLIRSDLYYTYPLNAFYLKKVGYEQDMVSLLPQGLIIEGILRKPIVVQTLYGDSKRLPKGSEVYAEKGSGKWIIGTQIDRQRFEMVTENHSDIYLYIQPKDDRINVSYLLQTAFKKYLKKYEKGIKNDVISLLETRLGNNFEDICNGLTIRPTQAEIDTIRGWAKSYVFPALNDLFRSKKMFRDISSTLKTVYNTLWAGNKYKPADVTFVGFMNSVKKRSDVIKYKKEFQMLTKDKTTLSGKDFNTHREIMRKLNGWANSYGMSNNDELWATAIELFFYLPMNYRKLILSLMLGHVK